jgi:hypothetical protein
LAPVAGQRATRVLKWAEGPGVSTANDLWHRFLDPAESDEDLSVAFTASRGTLSEVATYAEPFELRKVHLIFSAQDQVVGEDDSRVTTLHLAKVSGGNVVDTWDGADFTAMMAAVDAWWASAKTLYPTTVTLDRVKVYKSGPDIAPPQPPVYDVDRNISGTGTGGMMPPQVAISVTEIAGTKLHWGRLYMPAPRLAIATTYGRFDSTAAGTLADAFDTLYEALKTAGLHPVVYRAPLPARTKANGASLPARDGSAWDVEKIQIDDVFDVIRSRRWKYPLLRTQREIA